MDYREFKKLFLKEEIKEYPNKVYEKPLASVIILTHNHFSFISDCLNNILNQKTDFDFEIILADDNSVDGTKELCEKFAKEYPSKIRFFPHKKSNNIKVQKINTGIFNALFSFYEARGKYIAYCDGDDFWTDEKKLAKQVYFLEENKNYVLCYHEVKQIKNKFEIEETESLRRDLSSLELMKITRQPLMNAICFRNLNGDYPFEITKVLNADNILVSLLGNYGKGKFLKNIRPSIYRIHSGGIWSMIAKEEKILHKIDTFKVLFHFYEKKNSKLSAYFKEKTITNYKSLIYKNFVSKRYVKNLSIFAGLIRFWILNTSTCIFIRKFIKLN